MSRKQMLTKKVAHTLLAMSIVSASGLNLWAGTAWAADDGNNGADNIQGNVISLPALTLVGLVVMVQTVLPAAVLMMPAVMAVTAVLQALAVL